MSKKNSPLITRKSARVVPKKEKKETKVMSKEEKN
jgi:hypothetical protein